MEAMVGGLLPVAVLLLAVVLGCCLWFSWRGARHLQAVADGLDTLAQGGVVQLPTTGFAGELAEKLNETGEQLRRRNEIIARRGASSCSRMRPCLPQPGRKPQESAPKARRYGRSSAI